MESVMRKIFSGKPDEEVHGEFVKFGKGVYPNRYVVQAKKQKDRWVIKTGPEFANFFVRRCLEGASSNVDVNGVIVANLRLEEAAEFKIERIKQFMGIKQAVVSTNTSPKSIISLMDRFPKAFFALSFSTKDCVLKIKPKAPKSAKPASGGEKAPKAEFCSLKTSDKSIAEDLFFDAPNFETIDLKHTLEIDSIIVPAGEKDPVKMRGLAKRKGKVLREATIDGKKISSTKEFTA